MKQTSLLVLIICVLAASIFLGAHRVAYAAKLFVTWTAPTQNTDGTPLTDLAAYVVQWGSCTATGSVGKVQGSITVTAAMTEAPIYPTNLSPACVQIFAMNSAGVMSTPVYVSSTTLQTPPTLLKPTH